jgi:hypothetical protein
MTPGYSEVGIAAAVTLSPNLHVAFPGAGLRTAGREALLGRSPTQARTTVQNEVMAARVAQAVTNVGHDLSEHFVALREIHAAPDWLRPGLVGSLAEHGWTVEQTRTEVAKFKDLPDPLRNGSHQKPPNGLPTGPCEPLCAPHDQA